MSIHDFVGIDLPTIYLETTIWCFFLGENRNLLILLSNLHPSLWCFRFFYWGRTKVPQTNADQPKLNHSLFLICWLTNFGLCTGLRRRSDLFLKGIFLMTHGKCFQLLNFAMWFNHHVSYPPTFLLVPSRPQGRRGLSTITEEEKNSVRDKNKTGINLRLETIRK